ncbi:MAG: DUF58 domain-containing protein [Planctomycetaceae bacterium]
MMTARARWLVLPGAVGLFLGMLRGQMGLATLSLSVLIWIITEWAVFCWRVWYQLPGLRVSRTVNGRSGTGGVLWCGRPVHVTVKLESASGFIHPILRIKDVLPENVELLSESPRDPQVFIESAAAGREMSAANSAIEARTGNQLSVIVGVPEISWSYTARMRGAGKMLLPGLRLTIQDALGFFRVERFIDLRQEFRVLPNYAETDSPQSMIKRTNALSQHGIHRLQRSGMGSELLELREYVPGDPPKSIAWKVSARRDKLMTRQYESEVPVRVQLILDGTIGTRLGGFGRRLIDQMNFVACSVAKSAISAGDPVGAVLFDERGQRRIKPGNGDKGFYSLVEAFSEFSVPPPAPPIKLTPELLNTATNVCGERFPELMDDRFNQVPFALFPISPWKRRIHHVRSMLAGAFAEIFALGPATQVRLIYDDAMMGLYMQHFLVLTGMSWMEPVIPPRERGFHDGMARMELLSDAVRTTVAHARDNEVLVILSDLLDCAPAISHLLPALRMARGRHHRVAVVCPSPTFVRPGPANTTPRRDDVADLLFAAEQIRNRELKQRMNRELRRLGIAVSMSGESNAIRMVMAETELARSGRTAGSSVRAAGVRT